MIQNFAVKSFACSSNGGGAVFVTASKWRVLSSNPLESVMAIDVGDGKLLCLVRRRVRKQSMHTVYGLVFHPREPSLYRWNCFFQIGQGDCFDRLAGEGLREDERQFLRRVVAFLRLKAETIDTSRAGVAFRAISLLSTRAITSLTAVVRITVVPNISLRMSKSEIPLSKVSRII